MGAVSGSKILHAIYVISLLGCCGWLLWHRQFQQAACEMTFMHPRFVELGSPLLPKAGGYTLHKYMDGSHRPSAHSCKMQAWTMQAQRPRLAADMQPLPPFCPRSQGYCHAGAVHPGQCRHIHAGGCAPALTARECTVHQPFCCFD